MESQYLTRIQDAAGFVETIQSNLIIKPADSPESITEKIEADLKARIQVICDGINELRKTMNWDGIDRHLGHRHTRLLMKRWKESGGIMCRTYANIYEVLFGSTLDHSFHARAGMDYLRSIHSLKEIGALLGIPRADMLYYRLPDSDLLLKTYLKIRHHCAPEVDHVK